MTLIRWTPARTLYNLRQEVDRLFEDFFSPDFADEMGNRLMPRVDIEETKDKYISL